MEKIGTFIMAPDFPRGRQLRVKDYIEYLVEIKWVVALIFYNELASLKQRTLH